MSFVQPPPRLDPEPPPVLDPPRPSNTKKKASWIVSMLVLIGAKIKTVLALGFYGLKFGKILLTGSTMFVSMWFYALFFGWKFAIGFVILIFVHEMGHVFVAWRQGQAITAPVFLPGMGAVIFSKFSGQSAWAQALMGIGGPVGGTLGALACWAIYAMTGNLLFLALAYTAFLINLFNLIPMVPLDGGWITGAISPYLWLIGTIALIVMFATGHLHNPMIFILVLLSLPRLWRGLRYGDAGMTGQRPTISQRVQMSVYYLGLAGFLFWAMGATDLTPYIRATRSTQRPAPTSPLTRGISQPVQ